MERASAEKRVETSGVQDCSGPQLRRIGFFFRDHGQSRRLGVCCDLLADAGGTAVLAETTEIFGAEHLLVKRARNRAVAEKLLGFIAGYKSYLKRFGGSFDDNPTPGNKEGGLTNIVEKSLGAVAKAGTSPLMDVVDYAERIAAPGFVFMNTPGYDPVSLTGLAAGGVNLIAFTTGRGSAIGFPTIPVIKIATNSATVPAHAATTWTSTRAASPTAIRASTQWDARSSRCCCASHPASEPRASGWATTNLCRGGSVRCSRKRRPYLSLGPLQLRGRRRA